MKVLVLILLSFSLHSNCSVDMINVDDSKLTGLDMFQITEALCNVTEIRDSIVMHKIVGDWARALVNKKEIIYLHRTDKWRVISRKVKFEIRDWERFSIPSSIR